MPKFVHVKKDFVSVVTRQIMETLLHQRFPPAMWRSLLSFATEGPAKRRSQTKSEVRFTLHFHDPGEFEQNLQDCVLNTCTMDKVDFVFSHDLAERAKLLDFGSNRLDQRLRLRQGNFGTFSEYLAWLEPVAERKKYSL
jgi:hypothetical protein